MANMYWKGQAAAVAQVDTFTPGGTIETGDVFILTVTGENGDTTTVTFANGNSAATIAAGLVAAWNASTHYLCTGITASGTATVILTADVAGVPFNVVGTTTEAGGGAADDQTFTRAATLANSGPYDWNTQVNWTGGDGDLPGTDADDVVYVEGDGSTNPVIKYGMNQSAIANALAALYCTKCQVGENGSAGKNPSYLQIKAAKVEINYNYAGSPTFASPVNIDVGATASTITVYNSGTNSPATEPSVNIKANENTTDIYVHAGKVGIACHAGETTTCDNIHVIGSTAYVYIGDGVTLDQIDQRNGTVYCRSAIVTADVYAGTFATHGTGAITTANIKGGTATLNATGTITNLNMTGGTTDFTANTAARTVTTPKLGIGATVKFDPAIVTFTNKLQPVESAGNVQLTAA
jgi:hypothetical protein